MPEIITFSLPSSVKETEQCLSVLRIHVIPVPSLCRVEIQIFSPDLRHTRGVTGRLHPSFDLQAVDARLDNIREDIQAAEIPAA